MDVNIKYISREDQAKAEIGVTVISRHAAVWCIAIFLSTIVVVPAIDQMAGGWRSWGVFAERGDYRKVPRQFEAALEEESAVDRAVRPVVRSALTWVGGSGVDKVYRGREGWLFYEPDILHVASRGFLEPVSDGAIAARLRGVETSRERNPIPAILDFRRQLRARGIELIVMPTPVKPMVHPEMLWKGVEAPAENESFARFETDLKREGVLIFDPTIRLVAAAKNGRQFLATDTHWRPEAMELVAAELAQFVTKNVELPQSLGMEYRRNKLEIRGKGDLAAMLETSQSDSTEAAHIHPITQPDGRNWTPAENAEILISGDSFSNIFSAEPMGWGAAAGLAEQVSFCLSRPIDAIRRNDNGAFATRQMLADEMARGNDRLKGKKVLIWQFAARELSFGDWRLIPLNFVEKPLRRVLVPPPGVSWMMDGLITGKGAAPRPGNVAYRDHILAVHLVDISVDEKAIAGGEAIIYLRSMTNGKLTDAASLQIGQRVRIKVRDWSEVSRQYEFINRSDLLEGELRSQPACWGELVR
jgi:hypothetical protein